MAEASALPNRADKSFLVLLRNVLLWNLAVAALVGLLFWWFETHGAPREIWTFWKISLVYANVYGLLMGLSMPYLGQRIAAFRPPWKWIGMVLTLVALSAVGSLIIGVILVRMEYTRRGQFWAAFAENLTIATIVSLIIGLSIGVYEEIRNRMERTTLQLRAQELEKERALKLASETQLASLESRLQPHFLFNTLNSISALIREDPDRAERMVRRLAALLRFSLDAAAQRLVPLSLEMKIVADYLEIERERLGERLNYSLDLPAELEPLEVPPLSVQTLVENSVKYAIAPSRAGGTIRVKARAKQDKLVLEIRDSGPGFELETIPSGRGLDNLQDRLASLFGDSASLAVHAEDSGTLVAVSLPRVPRKAAELQ
jgi:sensor histidine kinase YesM